MKTPTIVWAGILVLVIIGGAWWAFRINHTYAPAPASTSSATTSSVATPGDNLALGEDSNAKVGKHLIGYNGMTVYTYAPDTAGVSSCTGLCAAAWPPYIVTSKDNLVGESPISGTLGTITRANGSLQLTYNGKPLYFYSGDLTSGDTNGQGIEGVWYVAKP